MRRDPRADRAVPGPNLQGMRLTIPHYFRLPIDLGLDDAEGWDALRMTPSPFAVPATRAEWEHAADARPELAARAEVIASVAEGLGADVVASYGVGAALMERHLVGRVDRLVCSDYTPETMRRVRDYLPAAEVKVHDLMADPPLDADLHVFHRVDTEFTDAQWHELLSRFPAPVLFAISELAGPKAVVREAITRLRGGKEVGWLRNEAAFRALVPERFSVQRLRIGDLPGFLLMEAPPA